VRQLAQACVGGWCSQVLDPPSTTSSSPTFTKGAKGALPHSVSSTGDAETLCKDLLVGLPRFKHGLRLWGTNFLHFVRQPGHVKLCGDPRFDF